jgi:hypothetical protein
MSPHELSDLLSDLQEDLSPDRLDLAGKTVIDLVSLLTTACSTMRDRCEELEIENRELCEQVMEMGQRILRLKGEIDE